jgi:hypothetical protein
MIKTVVLRSGLFLFLAATLGAQQFQDQTAARLPAQNVWTEGVCAGDVDGDGDLDLVYAKGDGFSAAGTARQSTICINNGAGVFTDQTATRFPVWTGHCKDIELLDVDNDGDLDAVLAHAFGEQPRLWINNGTGVFGDETATRFPVLTLNCFKVLGGDIDNDGDLDLALNDSGGSTFGGAGGQPRIFVNNGFGVFANETATRLPVIAFVSQVDANLGDVDGDYDLDLIVVSRDATPSRMYLNNGLGVFAAGPALPGDGTGTYEYGLGDLDNDNDADIFNVGGPGTTDGIFTNNGAGTYALGAALVGNPGSDDNAVALGDIDNDGDQDAAIAALSTQERILVNNGAGVLTYNAGLITALVDSSLDIKQADVDNDGDIDIVTAVGESGAFQNRLFLNATGVPDTVAPAIRLQALGAGVAAGSIPVRCGIRDIMSTDTDPGYQSVTLNYTVNGVPGSAAMTWIGADLFRGVVPFAPIGATVVYSVTAVDRRGNSATSGSLSFSPTGLPPAPILVISTTGVGDVFCAIYNPATPSAEEYLFYSFQVSGPLGAGVFFGLGTDAFNGVFTPIGVPPLHDFLSPAGLIQVSFGPGSLPLGLVFDARAVIMASPIVWTNILRVVI